MTTTTCVTRKLLLAAVAAWGLISCSPMLEKSNHQSTSESFEVTLRIMETSDVHGQLLSYDYFAGADKEQQGLIATAAVIQAARAEQPLNVLIENGDLIQGSALADWAVQDLPVATATHPIIAVLNALDYDVANLGNHEFNFGLDYLWNTYRTAEFPVISANLNWQSKAAPELQQKIQSTAWLNREVNTPHGTIPLKIAVIGVLPPQINQWDQHHLQGKVSATAMVSAATTAVREAQAQQADVIILAAHTGMPKQTPNPHDDEQTGWLLAGIEGVDALLLGHQHEVFPGTSVYDQLAEVDSKAGTVRGIPTVQPGLYGSHLGVIDLQLAYDKQQQRWQRSGFKVSARAVQHHREAAAELVALVEPAHKATLAFMQQPVGTTKHALSYRTARWQPSAAVQFVQRAQLWQAQQLIRASGLPERPLLSAAAPFDAAFSEAGTATTVAAGALTRGAIGDLYRYPNTLDVVELNGQQLRDWLERSAEAFVQVNEGTQADCWQVLNQDFPHYNYDTIFGLDYQIDLSQPVGQRIQNLRWQGKAIDVTQLFYVATNNYRANGGGDFPHLTGERTVARGADMLGDVLLGYLAALPERAYTEETENHWQVIGCGGRI